MSTRIMSAVWPLHMKPTPKAVLVSLADQANDQGYCWPSIETLCERTCYKRTAVFEALNWLEQMHAIRRVRGGKGKSTGYWVTTETFYEYGAYDSPRRAPVRQTDCGQRSDESATRTGQSATRTQQSAKRTLTVMNRHLTNTHEAEMAAAAPLVCVRVDELTEDQTATLRAVVAAIAHEGVDGATMKNARLRVQVQRGATVEQFRAAARNAVTKVARGRQLAYALGQVRNELDDADGDGPHVPRTGSSMPMPALVVPAPALSLEQLRANGERARAVIAQARELINRGAH